MLQLVVFWCFLHDVSGCMPIANSRYLELDVIARFGIRDKDYKSLNLGHSSVSSSTHLNDVSFIDLAQLYWSFIARSVCPKAAASVCVTHVFHLACGYRSKVTMKKKENKKKSKQLPEFFLPEPCFVYPEEHGIY